MSASELSLVVLGIVLIFIAVFIESKYIGTKFVLCVIGVLIMCCLTPHFYKKSLINECESKLELRHQKCTIIATPVPVVSDN